MVYKYIKRILDILFSLIGILLLFPVMLILCLLCSADTCASPFFLQERMGRGGTVFKIIKFRTMKKNAPDKTPARDISESGKFISPFGEWMRRSGADELPQIINIFMGQMSFIGPRPLMLSEKVLHREREKLGVYKARPGITGMAQIKCESIESAKEKALLDAEYTENITFTGDAKIIFQTFMMFLGGKHIDEHFHSPSE
jgi:lipopolysaccharide/colanic/teichoic acid biosynthesis glycosyltransferase